MKQRATKPPRQIACPQCREPNPENASQCWQCRYDFQKPAPFFVTPKFILGVVFLAFSGWLPSPLNAISLGFGLLIIGRWLSVGQHNFVRQFAPEEIEIPNANSSDLLRSYDDTDEAPIARIVNTILHYALRDGATRIYLDKHAKGIGVFYKVGDEWREQMKIPNYIWVPVREYLQNWAQSRQIVGRGQGIGIYSGHFSCHAKEQNCEVELIYEWIELRPTERVTLELKTDNLAAMKEQLATRAF